MTDARFGRRRLVASLPVWLVAGARPARCEDAIAAIERLNGGRLGVFAVDTGSGRTLAYRADERFLLCSTFKVLLAAAVLARVDAGRERLDRRVVFGERDLLVYAPVTRANVRAGGLSVEALCAAAVEVSDNTAANLLLSSVQGPAGLTRFIRELGDRVTRLDRFELALNVTQGELDTTSPRAMAGSVREIVLGSGLSPASRGLVEGWMAAATTGLKRLRAGLPPGWIAADKTGTGPEDDCNDVAVIRPPGRAPLVVAAYYAGRSDDLAASEKVLRQVGAAVARWAGAPPAAP